MSCTRGGRPRSWIPILHLVQEIAGYICSGDPLSDYAREVAAISVEDADAEDVLRLSLRHQLFGHEALVDDRVVLGQLRWRWCSAAEPRRSQGNLVDLCSTRKRGKDGRSAQARKARVAAESRRSGRGLVELCSTKRTARLPREARKARVATGAAA